MDWIDPANVISWEGRPRRDRRVPPKTFWEEYVETDEWYHKELLGDVPPEEIEAACFDSDINDAGSDSTLESEEEDAAYSEAEGEDASDTETVTSEVSEGGPTELVIVVDTESDTDSASSGQGESGGEGSDAESEGGSVPQTGADPVG